MRTTRHALVGLFAVAALVMTGACTEDEEPEAPADAPEAPETPAPSDPAADDDQDGGTEVDPGDITAPGTELSVGDTAVVPFQDGVIAITVTSIEEGDQDAFQTDFADSGDVSDIVAYYIWVTAENVSDEDMSFAGIPRLRALTPDGQTTSAIVTGESGDCSRESFPSDAGSGTTVDTCVLQGAGTGETVTGARWDDGDYDDDPIVWQQ